MMIVIDFKKCLAVWKFNKTLLKNREVVKKIYKGMTTGHTSYEICTKNCVLSSHRFQPGHIQKNAINT